MAAITPRPTYEEVLDLLDDVSAALDSVMCHLAGHMTAADQQSRMDLVIRSRDLCDALLRPEGEEEEENPADESYWPGDDDHGDRPAASI